MMSKIIYLCLPSEINAYLRPYKIIDWRRQIFQLNIITMFSNTTVLVRGSERAFLLPNDISYPIDVFKFENRSVRNDAKNITFKRWAIATLPYMCKKLSTMTSIRGIFGLNFGIYRTFRHFADIMTTRLNRVWFFWQLKRKKNRSCTCVFWNHNPWGRYQDTTPR